MKWIRLCAVRAGRARVVGKQDEGESPFGEQLERPGIIESMPPELRPHGHGDCERAAPPPPRPKMSHRKMAEAGLDDLDRKNYPGVRRALTKIRDTDC